MSGTLPPTRWTLASPEETVALGRAIGASLVGGVVIGLVGDLGAGKTRLVAGMAAGSEGVARVTSPTFSLVHEYAGRLTLYHLDAYRLRAPAELAGLGFDEMCDAGGAVVVEWADRVADALPDDLLLLKFSITGATSRLVSAEVGGPLAQQCLTEVRNRTTAFLRG